MLLNDTLKKKKKLVNPDQKYHQNISHQNISHKYLPLNIAMLGKVKVNFQPVNTDQGAHLPFETN